MIRLLCIQYHLRRVIVGILLLWFVPLLNAKPPVKPSPPKDAFEIATRLQQKVNIAELFDQPDYKLGIVLETISDKIGVPIKFEYRLFPIQNNLNTSLRETEIHFVRLNAIHTYEQLLMYTMSCLKSETGESDLYDHEYMIENNRITIIPKRIYANENLVPLIPVLYPVEITRENDFDVIKHAVRQREYFARITVKYDDVPLETILQDLETRWSRDVILMKDCKDKATTKVSIKFRNASYDTALLMLAEQVDLKVATLGNQFVFVTEERFQKLNPRPTISMPEAKK